MLRTVALALLLAGLAISLSPYTVASQAGPQKGPTSDTGSSGNHSPHGGSLAASGIVGNISISNISPLCTLDTGTVPSNSTTQVVANSSMGQETFIPVSWFVVDTCVLFGTFQAGLDPGTYSLTLSYCLGNPPGPYYPAGCPNAACGLQSCNLPVTVVVEPGKFTPVNISITTGIY